MPWASSSMDTRLGKGDMSSRGARFNSAVRYHDTHRAVKCLVIIVSEDGMINLLPNLRRQVARDSVESVVRQLEESLTDDPDYEVFFRHWEHLESLAFYLDGGTVRPDQHGTHTT